MSHRSHWSSSSRVRAEDSARWARIRKHLRSRRSSSATWCSLRRTSIRRLIARHRSPRKCPGHICRYNLHNSRCCPRRMHHTSSSRAQKCRSIPRSLEAVAAAAMERKQVENPLHKSLSCLHNSHLHRNNQCTLSPYSNKADGLPVVNLQYRASPAINLPIFSQNCSHEQSRSFPCAASPHLPMQL